MTSSQDAKLHVQEVPLDLAEKAIQQADVLIDVREAEEYHGWAHSGCCARVRGVLELRNSGTPALAARDTRIVAVLQDERPRRAGSLRAAKHGLLATCSPLLADLMHGSLPGKSVAQPEQPSFE